MNGQRQLSRGRLNTWWEPTAQFADLVESMDLSDVDCRRFDLVMVTHLRTWKIDQPALGELATISREPYEDFFFLTPQISKGREAAAEELVIRLDSCMRGLDYMDKIQKEHGIVPDRLPDGAECEPTWSWASKVSPARRAASLG